MTYTGFQNYLNSCKNFAKDTMGWGGLDERQQYTADGSGGWAETCDGDDGHDSGIGGLNIEWAFHLSDEKIELYASREFANQIGSLIELIIDEFDDYTDGCDSIITYLKQG